MWLRQKNREPANKSVTVLEPDTQRMPSYISHELKIVGTLASAGEVQIDGKVEGNVCARVVVIGEEGVVDGDVLAVHLAINGHVRGSVRARKVELGPGSVVDGHMIHGTLGPDVEMPQYREKPKPPVPAPSSPPLLVVHDGDKVRNLKAG